MKNLIAVGLMAFAASTVSADVLPVGNFNYYGPFPLSAPLIIDSVDVKGKKFVETSLDNAPSKISLKGMKATPFKGSEAPGHSSQAIHMLSFNFENSAYATPELEVKGVKNYTVYVDGKKIDGNRLSLRPATHNVVIRYLSTPSDNNEQLQVSLKADNEAGMTVREDGKRRFTLDDVLHGTAISRTSISPDGKYLITSYATTRRGGKSTYTNKITSLPDGKTVAERSEYIRWMPNGSRYCFERASIDGNELVAVDAATGVEEIIVADLPEDVSYIITPDEKSLILTSYQEGRKETGGVYEVIQPEDRQPGWRNRASLSIMDIASGVVSPLTFGNRNVYLNDISADSRKLLISSSHSRLERRPTTLTSIYCLDLNTMKADTIVKADGFVAGAKFSPDATKVVVSGTPEALDGIGKNVPEGRTPSMTDNQLYVINLSDGNITPVTKGFHPSVESFSWSPADGMIYLTAEDRDCKNLFRLNPANGKFDKINVPEEVVNGFTVPDAGRNLVWYGESASSPKSLYLLDTKTLRSSRIATPKEDLLADVQLGRCDAWDFVNSRGDTICGRFYLPPDFDPAKKYPMIVNYYGGCSPTSRNFESRYPHNAYAAQGYVVYVIEPSGATGFGQEFASRHVNTAGDGVAQDIIEGTKKFCEEHPYVNDKKIGCIGASYGGFMTQYLQTVTDIFAAAISHAGISDHTSYWGEGYWGCLLDTSPSPRD
ncbi:MAG: prolyl oligopeptidase family serine peptidase [Muribaculaceae bacterium]|nr:prolyl oligopeptidase family serine peptidase [Muribaculaceae bacterium]